MKKYVKPELFYERYELSQHIADCAWELTSGSKETCSAQADPDLLPIGSDRLFLSDGTGCTLIGGEGGAYQNYCYQDGAQGVRVFAS